MEYAEIVVSDSQFEYMAKVPGVKRDETGKLLTWDNGEVATNTLGTGIGRRGNRLLVRKC
jgi:hypothetical protein